MANHKSALKRVRANVKKRDINKYQHKTMRNALKDVRTSSDKKHVEDRIPVVVGMIDKLAKKNVIHKNKAANLKSSIARHFATLS